VFFFFPFFLFFFFFFSSRRRHTRSLRDWSSDVCSSDLVYKPHGSKPKSGHPALLMFRDTLDGQNAIGWDPFIQFFVSDGYLVFAPNVRGSSGQGKAFRQLVYEHGGDYDIRDAFIGLDKLSSEGLIDTERLGI